MIYQCQRLESNVQFYRKSVSLKIKIDMEFKISIFGLNYHIHSSVCFYVTVYMTSYQNGVTEIPHGHQW